MLDCEDGGGMVVCGSKVGYILLLGSTLLDGDKDGDVGGFRMLISTLWEFSINRDKVNFILLSSKFVESAVDRDRGSVEQIGLMRGDCTCDGDNGRLRTLFSTLGVFILMERDEILCSAQHIENLL